MSEKEKETTIENESSSKDDLTAVKSNVTKEELQGADSNKIRAFRKGSELYIFLIPEEDFSKGYWSVESAKAYNDLEGGYKNVIINEDDIKKFKKIDKKDYFLFTSIDGLYDNSKEKEEIDKEMPLLVPYSDIN